MVATRGHANTWNTKCGNERKTVVVSRLCDVFQALQTNTKKKPDKNEATNGLSCCSGPKGIDSHGCLREDGKVRREKLSDKASDQARKQVDSTQLSSGHRDGMQRLPKQAKKKSQRTSNTLERGRLQYLTLTSAHRQAGQQSYSLALDFEETQIA